MERAGGGRGKVRMRWWKEVWGVEGRGGEGEREEDREVRDGDGCC